jgi:hypothetical protein
LQANLPGLMINSPKKFADQYLEMISLMGKRFVQTEWPTLVPVSLPDHSTCSLIGIDKLPAAIIGPQCDQILIGVHEEDLQEV